MLICKLLKFSFFVIAVAACTVESKPKPEGDKEPAPQMTTEPESGPIDEGAGANSADATVGDAYIPPPPSPRPSPAPGSIAALHSPAPPVCARCHEAKRPTPTHYNDQDCVSCHSFPSFKVNAISPHSPSF